MYSILPTLSVGDANVAENIFILSIKDLRLWAHLGVSTEEKAHKQMISLDITIKFREIPPGAYTDSLGDTICYSKLVKMIEKYCTSNQFNLIEYMAQSLQCEIMEYLSDMNQDFVKSVSISVQKLSPPVANIHGGVSCIYSSDYGD